MGSRLIGRTVDSESINEGSIPSSPIAYWICSNGGTADCNSVASAGRFDPYIQYCEHVRKW